MRREHWIGLSLLPLLVAVDYIALTESAINKDLLLTRSQKAALDTFKQKILKSGILTQDYMKQEIYLIMWLRARDFNIDQAMEMLQADLKWRKVNKMDTILQEDFSDYKEKYPYYTDTVDKDGKPILSGNLGEWDLRAIVASGRTPQMMRYIARTMEDAAATVRRFQSEGKNITQGQFFINMDNYNVMQQGCVQCVSFYLQLINNYQNHYPGYVEHIILIKTPPVFEAILGGIRPFMNPMTRNAMRVYGYNKSQWRNALLEITDDSQLAPDFGGTFHRED